LLDFTNPVFLLWLLAGSFQLVWDLTGRCNANSERAVLGPFFMSNIR